MFKVIASNTPLLGGLAIVEDQYHETALIEAVKKEQMEEAEHRLLKQARSLMPLLPFKEIDLLIVDKIGKNVSGAGMDPNVINRSVHGTAACRMINQRTRRP